MDYPNNGCCPVPFKCDRVVDVEKKLPFLMTSCHFTKLLSFPRKCRESGFISFVDEAAPQKTLAQSYRLHVLGMFYKSRIMLALTALQFQHSCDVLRCFMFCFSKDAIYIYIFNPLEFNLSNKLIKTIMNRNIF